MKRQYAKLVIRSIYFFDYINVSSQLLRITDRDRCVTTDVNVKAIWTFILFHYLLTNSSKWPLRTSVNMLFVEPLSFSLVPLPMQCLIFQLLAFPYIGIISHAILALTTSRCQCRMDNDITALFGKPCMYNTINKLITCPNTFECLAQYSVSSYKESKIYTCKIASTSLSGQWVGLRVVFIKVNSSLKMEKKKQRKYSSVFYLFSIHI